MTIQELKNLPTHRLQAYYEKHLHVERLPNETMHEHDCDGDNCSMCEQINNLHTLAHEVLDELKKRPFHRKLRKRFHKTYECGY